jgi:PII-like signaling protein
MIGYQVTFYTSQDRRHHGEQIGEWLLQLAHEMNFRGATVIAASEGIGQRHRIHSTHFFDLSDQPLCIVLAVTHEEGERLFARLKDEKIELFYIKAAVEFGVT